MPLINGQKMACEPCIRGHRSTKCTHANERLMVPVRKPGRPLSSCPHPASRPCSCGRVTAAIPKKQQCHCGSNKSAESPASVKPENGDSTSESTPQSPASKTSSSYRVQKTNAKSGASSRRQSVDPVALQRMDPNMLNIMPAYDGMPQKPAAPLPNMSPYGAMGMTPAEGPFGPTMYPMFQPHMPPPMMSPDGSKSMMASHPAANAQVQDQTSEPAAKVGSCCGGGGNENGSSVPSTLPSVPSPPTKAKAKSCCSSGINSPKPDQTADTVPTSEASTPSGMVISPFPPIMMPNGMYAYYPQPTVFTYPPQYGSYLQPLQPEQWRQVMASMTFAGQGGMPSPYGMPGTAPYPPPGAPHTSHSSAGTSHQCSCGASCQCIGCAAHPYNEATQNYVKSAWESMMDDSQRAPPHANGGYTQANGHGRADIATTNGSNGTTVVTVGPVEGTVSPVAPQTPSEAASGLSEEQALSANDFFFVSYPFGDSLYGHSLTDCRGWNIEAEFAKGRRVANMILATDLKGEVRIATLIGETQPHALDRRLTNEQRHRHLRAMTDTPMSQAAVTHRLSIAHRIGIEITEGDLPAFEPLFADYLSLQKQKDIEEMDDREVRGRWKSFVGKWNRGELAEGWYDPEMFARVSADNQGAPPTRHSTGRKDERDERAHSGDDSGKERNVDSEDEDDYGPTLPTSDRARRSGPGIPTLQDLSLRAELAEEDKQASIADLRA
ncbi:hypothetical protein NM208_g15345 [Fusarium decemcellulare]|uniref:Uncharacterized protein n=1 Tax=Fusarium decemcellulare TaxID=57161 RepID=A0ACC1RGP8_9HYPO|nr:hypothetical protein NM208_g15345 [Fusarium decemcellulare]